MSTLVYMKILEQTPTSYDAWMRFFTLGRIDRIKAEIAQKFINANDKVLEIGCGAGSLAALINRRGAKITAIDISEKMLTEARKKTPEAEFHHLTALEIEQFGRQAFDKIVATLSFSELSEEELNMVVKMAADALKPGGLLIVADEVQAPRLWQRFLAATIRWPLTVITFLITQQTTNRLHDFEAKLLTNDFTLVQRQEYLLGTMALFIGEKI